MTYAGTDLDVPPPTGLVRSWMCGVEYRPSVEFEVKELNGLRPALVIRTLTHDSRRRGTKVVINHVVPVPPMALLRDRDGFVRWLRSEALARFELHERDEWLQVDGALPFDPHR